MYASVLYLLTTIHVSLASCFAYISFLHTHFGHFLHRFAIFFWFCVFFVCKYWCICLPEINITYYDAAQLWSYAWLWYQLGMKHNINAPSKPVELVYYDDWLIVTVYVYRAFHSCNIDLLLQAYLTYVRPLIEHDSVIWSPYSQRHRTYWKRSVPFYQATTWLQYLALCWTS